MTIERPHAEIEPMKDMDRKVDIKQVADGHRVRVSSDGGESYEIFTRLPLSLAIKLSASYGRDTFVRIEDPQAYSGLKDMLRRRGISFNGFSVLDVGCCYGTSSLAACRLGARLVVGIDVDFVQLRMGGNILRELAACPDLRRCGGDIHYVRVSSDCSFPFAQHSFDVVLANALFEHVPSSARPHLVRALWSLVRPGGYFIVHETPNRWWPRDGHTTGLWLIPWLPKPAVRLVIGLLCKRYTREQAADWSFMVDQGIRGVSYREIARHAPGHDASLDMRADDIGGHFNSSLRQYHSFSSRLLNSCYRFACRLLAALICKPFGRPNTIVTPDLYMSLRKNP